MAEESAASYLADQLERLMALPIGNESELERWYTESSKIEQTLQEKFPGFVPSGDFWHFIADADIRSRDSGYKDYQHRKMADYIARLHKESKNA